MTHLDRITAVLREHRSRAGRIPSSRKGFIHNITGCTGCDWISYEINDRGQDDHAAHAAEKVAEALQLDRRETALAPADYPEAVYPETIGHAGRSFSEMTEVWPFPAMRPSDVVVVHRSATRWEVQE